MCVCVCVCVKYTLGTVISVGHIECSRYRTNTFIFVECSTGRLN